MPVLQPRKEQDGTVCQPEKVLGHRKAVNDGMSGAVVETTAAAVAAAAAPFIKNSTACTTTMLPTATAVPIG